MTCVSAGHIVLTPAQPVGSGWPQKEFRAFYRLSYRPEKERGGEREKGVEREIEKEEEGRETEEKRRR